MKTLNLPIVLLGLLLGCNLQAAVALNVSGGTSDTPLTINITTGDSFTAAASHTVSYFAVFKNFWNNTAALNIATATTETVSLGGVTTANSTGAFSSGSITSADLLIGFGNITTTLGQPVVLSTGTRVTGNLSLVYNTINASGTIFLIDGTFSNQSSSSTWVVPENHHYAALGCVLCLGFAVTRKLRAQHQVLPSSTVNSGGVAQEMGIRA